MDHVLEIALAAEPILEAPRPRRKQEESGEQADE
jgi:hypothetical protein